MSHTIHTHAAPDLEIPKAFDRLRDVVYNLWWSWSPEAHELFDRLAPATWRHYRNPIDVLIDLDPERWKGLAEDEAFTRSYHALVERFDSYMGEEATWFSRHHPAYDDGPFAYFSMEFGWHECMQIYSGGLGVLSGDHCNEVEATSFHEGIPGHHLQVAIATELGDSVPAFRRHGYIGAYAEGWALYTERLADEMGLYGSQLDRMGMLSLDSLRSSRLVVDTGSTRSAGPGDRRSTSWRRTPRCRCTPSKKKWTATSASRAKPSRT